MDVYCRETLRAKLTNMRTDCGFAVVSPTLIYNLFNKKQKHQRFWVESHIYKKTILIVMNRQTYGLSHRGPFRSPPRWISLASCFPPVYDTKIYMQRSVFHWCGSTGLIFPQGGRLLNSWGDYSSTPFAAAFVGRVPDALAKPTEQHFRRGRGAKARK